MAAFAHQEGSEFKETFSKSSRKSSHSFKQGFDKFLADLSITGNYGQEDAMGGFLL